MIQIFNEDEILNPGVRAAIIRDIEGWENKKRKEEAYRREIVYNGFVNLQVQEMLKKQFSSHTVDQMSYAITNIPISKKVVDKLARVYSSKVERIADEKDMETIHKLESELKMNQKMGLANKKFKLHGNAAIYVRPVREKEGLCLSVDVLSPHLYDVIEMQDNRGEALVYVLSNYVPSTGVIPNTDNKDNIIADPVVDEFKPKKPYIWWSDKYHFTTDEQGTIISTNQAGETQSENPIGVMPLVEVRDIDYQGFFAEKGSDLTDSAILVNSLLTQANHISIVQGYGQFYMTGKKLPRNVEVGPSNAIVLEYDSDDPKPEIGFANANPPLSELMKIIETQVALMLTTNNLSTSGVSFNLGSSQAASSGIALLIDKSESNEDVNHQQAIFKGIEPDIWNIIRLFLETYSYEFEEDFRGLGFTSDVSVNFGVIQPILSEAEKLANIEKRKALGINTDYELLMLDRDGITIDQAKEKLLEIGAEKAEKWASSVPQQDSNMVTNEDDQDGSNNQQDQLDD